MFRRDALSLPRWRPFLSTGAVRGNIQGQSHAFHYDVLFQARGREARIRPYVAVGVGAKYYVTTGPAPVPQPMPKIGDWWGQTNSEPCHRGAGVNSG